MVVPYFGSLALVQQSAREQKLREVFWHKPQSQPQMEEQSTKGQHWQAMAQ